MANQDQAGPLRPTYAAAFRCIGPECEDHCCKEWEIPLDRATYEAYRRFPPEKLGDAASEFVILNPVGSPPGMYARIERGTSGLCAFLGADLLCQIQKEYGPKLLSASCSIYPRHLSQVEGALEGTLSLSCPEAARQVLLDPDFLRVRGDLLSGAFRTDNFYRLEPASGTVLYKPYRWFGEIRALVVGLIRDRSRPVWQRVFLIGIFCMRLAEVEAAAESEAVPAILEEYEAIVETGALREELESMSGQPAVRLDVVRTLLEERVREEQPGSRFLETWRAFQEGAARGAILTESEERYYRPWMMANPHVLEGQLLNYVLQNLFPFGREGSEQSAPMSLSGEFLLLATQFSCLEVLLTGVAGFYRAEFAAQHVITAVQSFARAVEHDPQVRQRMVQYVTQRGLSGLEGIVVLLKN